MSSPNNVNWNRNAPAGISFSTAPPQSTSQPLLPQRQSTSQPPQAGKVKSGYSKKTKILGAVVVISVLTVIVLVILYKTGVIFSNKDSNNNASTNAPVIVKPPISEPLTLAVKNQRSQRECVLDSSYGLLENGGMYTDKGCRADFIRSDGAEVRCESHNKEYQECNFPI